MNKAIEMCRQAGDIDIFANAPHNGRKALALYSDALALDPQCVKALIERGNIYRIAGLKDKAIADYKAALALNNQDDSTAQALYRMTGNRKYERQYKAIQNKRWLKHKRVVKQHCAARRARGEYTSKDLESLMCAGEDMSDAATDSTGHEPRFPGEFD